MTQKSNENKRIFPRYLYPLWGILILSIAVYIVSLCSEAFADFYNQYPGAFVRGVLAHLTNWLPLSLTEIAIILSPCIVAFSIYYVVKRARPTKRSTLVFCVSLLTVASMFFSTFVLGFGCGYHGSTLDVKMGLEKNEVAFGELTDTAEWLADAVAKESDEVTFAYQSFSEMPYSLGELNRRLLDSYASLCDEYGFIQRLTSRVKPVMLSEAMSYTHITGVYTYFTGEANLNVNFPDYSLPFTAAHEMAHQRGIAREDEANFVAFLVCIGSDDPYIRYSGYLSMLEYFLPNLYADREVYSSILSRLPNEVIWELRAYAEFFEKYQDSTVGEISESINNGYLQMQGTVGTKSYGMAVDLAVAYFNAKIDE